LDNKNIREFEPLFREYFKPLCGFSMKYVHDLDEAKNLVHDAFIAVWQKFDQLPKDTNYRSYLYTTVRNRCLNHLRDQPKTVALEETNEISAPQSSEMETRELEGEIELAINALPEKCRVVFEMSRFEELKYAEIAEKLDISVKTVEGRMTKALGLLRDSLAHLITIAIIMWIFQGCSPFFVF